MEPIIIPDGGPLYAETNLNNILVEPWNAISSLVYLIPAFYCFVWINRRFKYYSFLTMAAILLTLGGIGSTVYHAFRSSTVFLALDVLPIQLLTLLTIIYFWLRLFRKRWIAILILLVFAGVKTLLYYTTSGSYGVNLAYFLNGVMMFLPIVLYLGRTRFKNWNYIILSILFFAVSLYCRHADLHFVEYMYMGSHWLWHVFSAVGSGFLGYYLFSVRKSDEILPQQPYRESFV